MAGFSSQLERLFSYGMTTRGKTTLTYFWTSICDVGAIWNNAVVDVNPCPNKVENQFIFIVLILISEINSKQVIYAQ